MDDGCAASYKRISKNIERERSWIINMVLNGRAKDIGRRILSEREMKEGNVLGS